jgi:tetratricopeptide (TPR) repeat protein
VYKVLKDEGDLSGISKRFAKKRWLVFVAGWVLLLILIIVYPGPFRQLIKKAIFSISGGPLSKGSDSHGRLKWMEEQLKIDPNNLMLVLRLAGESMAQGDIDKAQDYFRRAEEINPAYQDVLLKYAERFEEEKNYTEAIKILELLKLIQKDEQSRQRLAERIDRLLQLSK